MHQIVTFFIICTLELVRGLRWGDRFMVLCTFCGGVLCISAIGFFAYYASIVRAFEWRISIEHYSRILMEFPEFLFF